MYCIHCNTWNEEDDNFCKKCGRRLEQQPQNIVAIKETGTHNELQHDTLSPENPQQNISTLRSVGKSHVIIGITIAVVIVLVIVMIAVFSNNDTTPQKANTAVGQEHEAFDLDYAEEDIALSEDDLLYFRTILSAMEDKRFKNSNYLTEDDIFEFFRIMVDIPYMYCETADYIPYESAIVNDWVYNAVEIEDLQTAVEEILGLSYEVGATTYDSWALLLTDRAYFTTNNGRGGYGEVIITNCEKQGDIITVTYDFYNYGTVEELINRTSDDFVSAVAEFKKNDSGSDYPYQIISISEVESDSALLAFSDVNWDSAEFLNDYPREITADMYEEGLVHAYTIEILGYCDLKFMLVGLADAATLSVIVYSDDETVVSANKNCGNGSVITIPNASAGTIYNIAVCYENQPTWYTMAWDTTDSTNSISAGDGYDQGGNYYCVQWMYLQEDRWHIDLAEAEQNYGSWEWENEQSTYAVSEDAVFTDSLNNRELSVDEFVYEWSINGATYIVKAVFDDNGNFSEGDIVWWGYNDGY